jgi:hypothetical protein
MLGSKRGEIRQNLCLGHSARKIFQHVADRDSGPLDSWLATTDACRDGDVIFKPHRTK